MFGRPSLTRPLSRLVALAGLFLLASAPAFARQKFEAELRLLLPDGKEEVRRVSDFRFVYYERRFVRKSTGWGKPARLQIRDLPHEESFLQNEELQKAKFLKIRRITFVPPEDKGNPARLVIERKKKRKAPIEWPVSSLRNTATSLSPHFRGRVDDQDVDFLPPGPSTDGPRAGPVLIEINFDFPGRIAPRKRF